VSIRIASEARGREGLSPQDKTFRYSPGLRRTKEMSMQTPCSEIVRHAGQISQPNMQYTLGLDAALRLWHLRGGRSSKNSNQPGNALRPANAG